MPYPSPYAGRLSDLLMQRGAIEGGRAQNRGAFLGGLIRDVAGIPAGLQQDRMAQAEAAERQQDRLMNRVNIGSQIEARTAQIAQQIREHQTEDEAKLTAERTRNTIGILSEYALLDPDAQRTAWPQVQQRLATEGGWEPERIPPQPMPTPWVKGQMAKWLPVDKAYDLIFPAKKAPISANPIFDLIDPDTKAIIRPGTPEVKTPPNPTEVSLAADAASPDSPTRDQSAGALGLLKQLRAREVPPVTPDTDLRGLAALLARQPSLSQNLTPGMQGQVMKIVANDPALLGQYEQTRMAPLRASATRLLTTLDDLMTVDDRAGTERLTPGARGLYGLGPGRLLRFKPGSQEANAKASLDQVVGNLTLNMLSEAKAQSRTGATGFGQLSHRELDVIESAATILKGEISEARALQELLKIRGAILKMLQPGPGERDTPTADDQAANPFR